jgi:hypothetical protein
VTNFHETRTREPDNLLRPLEQTALEQIEGGVYPTYDSDGNVITCTDPRRWLPSSPLGSGGFWS